MREFEIGDEVMVKPNWIPILYAGDPSVLGYFKVQREKHLIAFFGDETWFTVSDYSYSNYVLNIFLKNKRGDTSIVPIEIIEHFDYLDVI